MSNSSNHKSDFLKRYIDKEMYLQNPPLETCSFIDYCKKKGFNISNDELEFFEKEGLLLPIFRLDRPIINKQNEKKDESPIYSFYFFDDHPEFKKMLMQWVKDGNLYDPSTRSFQKWESFNGPMLSNGNQKIVSFYSSFQIYWLEKIKNFSIYQIPFSKTTIKINKSDLIEEDGEIYITSDLSIKFKLSEKAEICLSGNKIYKILEDKDLILKDFSENIDFGKIKSKLLNRLNNFNSFLKFLLSVQNLYYPYAKSGSHKINLSIDYEKWQKIKTNFALKEELIQLNFEFTEIIKWYKKLSEESQKILGKDLVQLWKNISWHQKNNLNGKMRLGIEYLQWAIMLKRIIEEAIGKHTLDVDELDGLSIQEILNFNPDDIKGKNRSTRIIREKRYYDPKEKKSYYHDKYKRLFYLANTLGIDYQPRLIVFVEGRTEEIIFPKVFEWYFGIKPEDYGIEFINFEGVDKLLSTSKNAQKLRDFLTDLQKSEKLTLMSSTKAKRLNQIINKLKKIDIIISNWTSFLSYNLEKWQIIPFFISDNEGSIKIFLESHKPIKFQDKNYNIPHEWNFLWGIDNKNKPFKGNNFELANFSNSEISLILSKLFKMNIDENRIESLREEGKSLNSLDDKIGRKKIEIANKLFDQLINDYEINKDNSVFQRPIFIAVQKIEKLTGTNHPPVDREIELRNKEVIMNTLNNLSN